MAKRKKPLEGSSGSPPGGEKPKKKFKLSWGQERFIEAYLQNGGNAVQAYRAAHPGCSYDTARVNGPLQLLKAAISEAIEAKRESDRQMLNFKREDALRLLLAMATTSLDDFTEVFKGADDRRNYRGLGLKRMALESAKKTERTSMNEGTVITTEIKIISPGERRAIINDLWEKLGFTDSIDKGISTDTIGEVLQFFANAKKSEQK